MLGIFFKSAIHLLWDKVFDWPGAYRLGHVGWSSKSSWNAPARLEFLHGFWKLNSGPGACWLRHLQGPQWWALVSSPMHTRNCVWVFDPTPALWTRHYRDPTPLSVRWNQTAWGHSCRLSHGLHLTEWGQRGSNGHWRLTGSSAPVRCILPEARILWPHKGLLQFCTGSFMYPSSEVAILDDWEFRPTPAVFWACVANFPPSFPAICLSVAHPAIHLPIPRTGCCL